MLVAMPAGGLAYAMRSARTPVHAVGSRVGAFATPMRRELSPATSLAPFDGLGRPAARSCTSGAARLGATRRWIDSIVLAERLCPFAAAPAASERRMRMQASHAADASALVDELAKEANLLARSESSPGELSHETTLLVLPLAAWCKEWHQLVSISWMLQAEAITGQGYEQTMQIVIFHPKAVRSTYTDAPTDAADFSLRSPFPIVQLLREADILAAVRSYPNPEGIPSRNAARLRALGERTCRERLQACLFTAAPGSRAASVP
mmetsp:Transcript_2302/g.7381  ORF Transcript_2302/g.7381 Transcript_2302/m.7381 type:complete len:264 (+) Transcript_2302:167-958(+)